MSKSKKELAAAVRELAERVRELETAISLMKPPQTLVINPRPVVYPAVPYWQNPIVCGTSTVTALSTADPKQFTVNATTN